MPNYSANDEIGPLAQISLLDRLAARLGRLSRRGRSTSLRCVGFAPHRFRAALRNSSPRSYEGQDNGSPRRRRTISTIIRRA